MVKREIQNAIMFIKLNHETLDVSKAIRDLRVALSVKLYLAEGSTRKSVTERKRYFEVSRGSVVEIDAIFDTRLT